MKNTGKSKADDLWLQRLGKKIQELIRAKGYASPYELWIEKGDEKISRSTINYIINGKIDPKVSTLRIVAKMLNVELVDLFHF